MVIESLVKIVLSELKQITQTETVVGEPITAGGAMTTSQISPLPKRFWI